MQIPLLHRYTQLMMLKKQIKNKDRCLKKYKRAARARWRKVRQIRSDLLEELRQMIDTQQKNDAKLKRVQARHSLNGILMVYKRWLRRWTKSLKMQRQQLELQQKQEEQWDRRMSQLKTKLGQQPNHKKLVDKCFTKLRIALKGWLDSPDRDTTIEGTVHTWEKEVEAIRKYLMDLDWLKPSTRKRVKKGGEKLRISGFSLFWDMEVQGKKSKRLPLTVTPRQSGLDGHKLLGQPKRKPKTRSRKRSPRIQQVEIMTDLKKRKIKTLKYKKRPSPLERAPSLEDIEKLFKLLINDGRIKVVKPHEIKKKRKLKKRKQIPIGKRRKLREELEFLDLMNFDQPIEDHEAIIKKFLKPKKIKGSKIKSIIRREALDEKKSLGLLGSKKKEIKFSGSRQSRETAMSRESDPYESSKEESQTSVENPLNGQSIIKPAEKLHPSFIEKFKLNEPPPQIRPSMRRRRKMRIRKIPEQIEDDSENVQLSDSVGSVGFNAEETKYLEDLEANTRLAKTKSPGQGKTTEDGPLLAKGKKGKSSHRSTLKPPTPKDFQSKFDTLEMPSSEGSIKKSTSKSENEKEREKDRLSRQTSESTLLSWEHSLERQAMGDGPQSNDRLPDRKHEKVKGGTANKDKYSHRIVLDGHSAHSFPTTAGGTTKGTFSLDEMNSQEKYKPIQHFLKDTIEQNSLLKAVPDSRALMRVVEKHHMWNSLSGLHDEMEAAGFSVQDMLSVLKDKYMQYLNQIVTDVVPQGDVVTIRDQEVVRLGGKIIPKAKFYAGLQYRDLKPHIRPWGSTPVADNTFTVNGQPQGSSVTSIPKLKSPRISSWLKKEASETEEKKSHIFDEIVSRNIAASVEDLAQLDAYANEPGQPVESFCQEGETDTKMDLQLTQSQMSHEERIQKLLSFNHFDEESISSLLSMRSESIVSAKGFERGGILNVEKRYSPTNLREVLDKYTQFFQSRSKSPFVKELENRRRLQRKQLKIAVSKVGFKVRKTKLTWRRHLREPINFRSTQNLYYAPRKTCRVALSSDEECSECGEILEQDQKPCTWEKCPRCGVEVAIPETLSAGSIEACAKNNLIRSVTKDICLRCGYIHKKSSPCPNLACLAKPNLLTHLHRIKAAANNYPESKPRPPKEVPKFCSPCGKRMDIWNNSSFTASAASLSSTGR